MSKKAIVIGSGLVGSLWTIYLKKAGYMSVSLMEIINSLMIHLIWKMYFINGYML